VIRGRPKSEIKASSKEVRDFFAECDRLAYSLKTLHEALGEVVDSPPSYRALQEWRRGTHTPKFAPFKQWLQALREKAKK